MIFLEAGSQASFSLDTVLLAVYIFSVSQFCIILYMKDFLKLTPWWLSYTSIILLVNSSAAVPFLLFWPQFWKCTSEEISLGPLIFKYLPVLIDVYRVGISCCKTHLFCPTCLFKGQISELVQYSFLKKISAVC